MAYKLLWFQTVADFKDNSMASRMNSGDSNDLNCIRIDPRTGENFWPKDSIDWQKINDIQIITISNCRKNIHLATDYKENSMASRINSDGSNDLNRIKIDTRTGQKFSFNVDIVAATAWHGQEASRF